MPTLLPSLPTGFGLSVVAHVGLIAVAVNGSAARLIASAEAPESRIEIEVTEPFEVEASDPIAAEGPRPAVRSARSRRHHHPYAVPPDHDAVPHDSRVIHDRAATAPPADAEPIGPAPSNGSEPERAPPALRFMLAPVGLRADVMGARAVTGASARAGARGLAATGVTPAAGDAGAGGDQKGTEEVFVESRVTSRARLVFSVPPVYPAAARRSELEADVPLEIVVDAAGRVTSIEALGGAEFGLAEAARAAVARYRFSPALRDGRAVRVRMHWSIQFRLR